MKKTLLMVLVALTVIAGMILWLVLPGKTMDVQEVLMIAGIVLLLGFSLFLAFRRFRDARQKFPAEDEMSKKIMKSTGATSYYISIYFWLILMLLEEKLPEDTHTVIGIGIMGMAMIFALSWIYHTYFSRKHE
ncbi:MAG: hypothetical protein JXR52_02930 [Bacteroidales bacterium]|nr:hypothetical protein [Bacteroidales bacterium]MBN2697754.1 hypothetical protein [Bacteroidales bacterium]